jgi:hypothetical protein
MNCHCGPKQGDSVRREEGGLLARTVTAQERQAAGAHARGDAAQTRSRYGSATWLSDRAATRLPRQATTACRRATAKKRGGQRLQLSRARGQQHAATDYGQATRDPADNRDAPTRQPRRAVPRAVTAHRGGSRRRQAACTNFEAQITTNRAQYRLTQLDYGQEGTKGYS